jgi:hypothetical protein
MASNRPIRTSLHNTGLRVHHLPQQSMLQTSKPTGGGACSPEGRQRQIESRINHGIRYECPVIPGVESPEEWEAHLADQEESLQPVGGFERWCVHVVALRQWQFFRLVRHELALVTKAIREPEPDNGDGVREADDVREVIERSESSLAEELFGMRDLMHRLAALATEDFTEITFTEVERRQILTAIIEQPVYDSNGIPHKSKLPGLNDDNQDDNDDAKDDGTLVSDHCESGADKGEVISATVLRAEIEEISKAKGVTFGESIQELADTLAFQIKERERRLKAARTHIGINLIPLDEKTVLRLTNYQRQINADISRALNHLLRSQALRAGQSVPLPLSVDVNVSGEQNNGLQ